MMGDLDFLVMGRFEVRRGGSVVEAGGGKRRAVLAALLLSANHTVTTERVAELVWGSQPPRSATNLVHGYIRDWRAALNPARPARASGDRVLSSAGGYLLRVDADESDLGRFRRTIRDGVAARARGDLPAARASFLSALAERRGPALQDFANTGLAAAAAQIEEEWLTAVRAVGPLLLEAGEAQRVVELTAEPVRLWPFHEELVALRMASLERTGRRAEALTLYDTTRRALSEELGVDPQPDLQSAYQRILRGKAPAAEGTQIRGATPVPTPLVALIGREQEQRRLAALAGTHRLVTVTGLGGVGKSQLLLHTLPQVPVPSGVARAYVDAAGVGSADAVCSAIARALGRTLLPTVDAVAALTVQLGDQPAFLALDNVLPGLAPAIEHLLRNVARLAVLATSRGPLGVPGEVEFRLAPLGVPDRDTTDVAEILAAPSVQLLVDRVAAASASRVPPAEEVRALGGICRRVGGLPLAIGLLAPWLAALTPTAVLERLDRPFQVLVGNEPGGRHAALRAVIASTVAAVPPRQRRLLAELAQFRSGARLDAIEATVASAPDVMGDLSALTARQLVEVVRDGEHERYVVSAMVGDYLREVDPDPAAFAERRVSYFAALAESAARSFGTLRGSVQGNRLAMEQAEIEAVLEHLREVGDHEAELGLAVDCLPLWLDRGQAARGLTRVAAAMDRRGDSGLLGASAHLVAAQLALATANPAATLAHAERAALIAADRSPAIRVAALTLSASERVWQDWTGPAEEGIQQLEAAIDGARDLLPEEARWGWCRRSAVLATALLSLIDVLRYRDPAGARGWALTAVDELAASGAVHYESFAERAVGMLAADTAQWGSAEHHLGRALELAERSGSGRSVARTNEELARMALARADLETASALACQATYANRDAGHAMNWMRCAALLADVHIELGEYRRAHAVLDEVRPAVTTYAGLARRAFAPREARIERLNGNPDAAAHHLAAIAALETAYPLDPNRVVYLVEAACLASANSSRRATLVSTLATTAERRGLALPLCEQQRLAALEG